VFNVGGTSFSFAFLHANRRENNNKKRKIKSHFLRINFFKDSEEVLLE